VAAQEKDSEFAQVLMTRTARAQKLVCSFQPHEVSHCSKRCEIDGPGARNRRGRSFCHWIWRGLFMMLLRDSREPAQPFCSDRRSNYDRSRGAVSRFLADSWPRLGHSTARRQIAGREVCHSPRRISCGAPLCAEDIGGYCAFSSPVGLAWVVVGEQPLLAAGVLVPRL